MFNTKIINGMRVPFNVANAIGMAIAGYVLADILYLECTKYLEVKK